MLLFVGNYDYVNMLHCHVTYTLPVLFLITEATLGNK